MPSWLWWVKMLATTLLVKLPSLAKDSACCLLMLPWYHLHTVTHGLQWPTSTEFSRVLKNEVQCIQNTLYALYIPARHKLSYTSMNTSVSPFKAPWNMTSTWNQFATKYQKNSTCWEDCVTTCNINRPSPETMQGIHLPSLQIYLCNPSVH